MQKTEITVSNNQNESLPENIESILKNACKEVLKYEKFLKDAEISVTFVTEEEIKQLNKEFRNKDSITDVLSFPMGENGEYDLNPENNCFILGDVVICVKRALEQSLEYGHSLTREITFLCVHSVLHLLGYDHIKEEDAAVMRPKEKAIMEILKISR